MRFHPSGPQLPDALLQARDQGRVVFFCGAGISRAKAGLPDFFELSRKVLDSLGVARDDPARSVLAESKAVYERTGIGLISSDRVFGLLERDFTVSDIERSVAKALEPAGSVDLSAHRILLTLAKAPTQEVRLVTTNFDLLFEKASPDLPTMRPPKLPDPARFSEFNGIVHLHGAVKTDYSGAQGEGFVLSSADFGRAYLSDGWAADFFRQIVERYVVVFVGYSADDPPIQYLLEALRKSSSSPTQIYAFDAGEPEFVTARWLTRGAHGIAYDPAHGHSALWDSLEAWSARAHNPDAWRKTVVALASGGPTSLAPHIRGQVAHVVSTYQGAREFREADPPCPAEWLCCFDPSVRLGAEEVEDDREALAFDLYGLDSDQVPSRYEDRKGDRSRKNAVKHWSAFDLTSEDLREINADTISPFRGHRSSAPSILPSRLLELGAWIARVSTDKRAIHWAARQGGLHPSVRQSIAHSLDSSAQPNAALARRAWRYLFEGWTRSHNDEYQYLFELQEVVKSEGWGERPLRLFSKYIEPYITTSSPIGRLREADEPESLSDYLWVDVSYPYDDMSLVVPDHWLARVVELFRMSLLSAIALERELGAYGVIALPALAATNVGDGHSRQHGFSGYVHRFARLFDKLGKFDESLARAEFEKWPSDDDHAFALLRIWATSRLKLSPQEFVNFVLTLTDEVFWSSQNRLDLLISLEANWLRLPVEGRYGIEKRLWSGPPRYEAEEENRYFKRRAWLTLTYVNWLHKRGCAMTEDVVQLNNRLSPVVPEWRAQGVEHQVEDNGPRGGVVRTDASFDSLVDTPLRDLLDKADQESGRSEDFLVEKKPLLGLASKRPLRLIAALNVEAKAGHYPVAAWRTLLNRDARKSDRAKLSALIAHKILSMPAESAEALVAPIAEWINDASENLVVGYTELLNQLIDHVASILAGLSDGRSGILRNNQSAPDWVLEAINAPAGKIAQAHMKVADAEKVAPGEQLSADWLDRSSRLVSLAGDSGRYVSVIFCHGLSWLFIRAEKWVEEQLLPRLCSNDLLTRSAAWSGFLWGFRLPARRLFQLLKETMFSYVSTGSLSRRGYSESLAAMALGGWGAYGRPDSEACIRSDELRALLLASDEDFRVYVLSHLARWSAQEDDCLWGGLVLEFLQDVWPKQVAVRTPRTAVRLAELALTQTRNFERVAEEVLPLIVRAEDEDFFFPGLRKSGNEVFDAFPESVVAILNALLPSNPRWWPYGIDEVLKRLSDALSRQGKRSDALEGLARRWSGK
jgi:hypothetical protein